MYKPPAPGRSSLLKFTRMRSTHFVLLLIIFISACNNAAQSDKATRPDSVTAGDNNRDTTKSSAMSDTLQIDPSLAPSNSPITAALIKQTLQSMYKDDLGKGIIDSFSRRFAFYEYDLNDDGKKEILVATRGTYFCGSGGCTILLLDNTGKKLSAFTVSDYPVVISHNKSNGWKDLLIPSRGKNHLIKYTGKAYPSNPSTQPEFTGSISDTAPHALNTKNQQYPWFEF